MLHTIPEVVSFSNSECFSTLEDSLGQERDLKTARFHRTVSDTVDCHGGHNGGWNAEFDAGFDDGGINVAMDVRRV